MAKLTFSLDDETVRTLRRVAERTRKAQSLVVREAIVEYAAREETLPDSERERRLSVLEALSTERPTRPATAVDRELREVRRTRRTGWARSSD
jgi:metal-responsive CopG/Arc/MetJ family transcriptional regulator